MIFVYEDYKISTIKTLIKQLNLNAIPVAVLSLCSEYNCSWCNQCRQDDIHLALRQPIENSPACPRNKIFTSKDVAVQSQLMNQEFYC